MGQTKPKDIDELGRLCGDAAVLHAIDQAHKVDAPADESAHGGEPDTKKAPFVIELLSGAALMEAYPTPPEALIHGIVGRGEKVMLSAGSKAGKTWAMLALASAISTGAKWMGHVCKQGRVLLLNFELPACRLAERLSALKTSGVDVDRIDVANLRGCRAEWAELLDAIDRLASEHGYDAIIVDPIYKLFGSVDENSNSQVAELLGRVDDIAVKTGAAVIYVHHFSKGNKSEADQIDRASGAGAFARDPDAILTLTPHAEEDCFTFEATVRNYATPEPKVFEFKWPVFEERDDLNAGNLKRKGGRTQKGGPEDVRALLRERGGMSPGDLYSELAERHGVGRDTAKKWRQRAERKGWIENLSGLWVAVEEEGDERG